MDNQQPQQQTTKNANMYKTATIVLSVVGLVLAGLLVFQSLGMFYKDDSTDARKTIESEDNNQTNMVSELEVAPGISGATDIIPKNHYNLLDGYVALPGQRYYLLTDSSSYDDSGRDHKEMTMYLLDLSNTNSSVAIEKIDLWTVIRPYYEEKISNLPSTLAAGTQNATQKASCENFRVSYLGNQDITMFDRNTSVAFRVYYGCEFGGGELSLGTEAFVLDVERMTVTHKE